MSHSGLRTADSGRRTAGNEQRAMSSERIKGERVLKLNEAEQGEADDA
jgi:hypothetical protein